MWSNKGKINLCRKCTQTNTFKAKLRLFSRQQSFTHCPILATLKEAPQHAKKYRKPLDGPAIGSLLLEKFDKALQLVLCPFSQYPETPPQKLQLEHIKLQCDSVLKVKFSSLKLDESFLFFFFFFKEDTGGVWLYLCEWADAQRDELQQSTPQIPVYWWTL